MKHLHVLLTILLAGSTSLFAYEPPSEGDLDQLMANPGMTAAVLGDANGAEAAVLITRIIERIEESNLGKAQKEYLIAFYTSKIVLLLPASERNQFATDLVAAVPEELVPVVFAGLSIGSGASNAFLAHLKELAGENEIYLAAIQTPNVTLTTPVYNLLVATLSTAQALPPPVIDALPPPIPVGEAGGAPSPAPSPAPPVAEPYDGQG